MGMPPIVEDSPQRLNGAQLGQAITRHWAQLNAANHHLLRMIAEFDRRGDWREQGTIESSACEALPDHLAYARAEGKSPRI
tara:strand:- start:29 stop:271 length:243 start_codon:yes stop_codon:yes gene_type:complete